MDSVILGVDIGTTGTKTVAINQKGDILANAYREYPTYRERNLWAEQDAMDWWWAVVDTIRECTRNDEIRRSVVGIGLSSQGGSLVPVNSRGIPLRRAITWMDRRAIKQSLELREDNLQEYVYNTTGWKLGNGLNALQIRWIKDNEPEVFRNTYKFLSTIDFIAYQLTGEFCIDPSSAGITQLMNIHEKRWDPVLLDWVGITPEKLPNIKDSGEIIGILKITVSEQLDLPQKVIIAAGAHDQYCAATGAGVVESGDTLLATGTAWVILEVLEGYKKRDSKSYLSYSRHAADGKWGALYSLGSVGKAMEWFKYNLGKTMEKDNYQIPESFADIDNKASHKPLGSNGLMFYPHFNGTPYPVKADSNRGTLMGLTFSHDRYDIARALMEGVAFDVRCVFEDLNFLPFIKGNLIMTGGATNSKLWPQIVADVLGKSVLVPKVDDVSSFGSAIIAGKALNWFSSITQGSRNFTRAVEVYESKKDHVEQYKSVFMLYQKRLGFLVDFYKL
jgi:xylulokinase